jgi:glycosyltransferase involved in cell wall biosynthesis
MNSLRILQIVPSLGIGGAEMMATHLTLGLAKRGHTVGVASLYAPEASELDELLATEGIRVWYLGKRPGIDLRIWPRLTRVLAEFQPDVAHSHLGILHYVLPPLLRRRPPLMVNTVHSLADKETLCWSRWSNRLAFRVGLVPVSVSTAVAASLEAMYGVKDCRHIANGIDVSPYRQAGAARQQWRTREGFDANDVLIVCVARLKAVKNHRMLLQAFAAANSARNGSARLLLLGEGPLRQELEGLARELGIERRTHFMGLRKDVSEALAAADCFVLSSHWEGNPLSVMEAMAAGLPVVATQVGGIPELVETGVHGMLTPPRDAAAMARALDLVAERRDLRAAWGQAAKMRAAESFDIERMVDNYASLYQESVVVSGESACPIEPQLTL